VKLRTFTCLRIGSIVGYCEYGNTLYVLIKLRNLHLSDYPLSIKNLHYGVIGGLQITFNPLVQTAVESLVASNFHLTAVGFLFAFCMLIPFENEALN